MGSKRPDRREFLKGSAALAGGLTLGAVTPAIGQTPAAGAGQKPAAGAMIKGSKELKLESGTEMLMHVTR